MTDAKRFTLGDILFEKLEKDQHFDELYNNILYNYSLQLFGLSEVERKPVDIDDALYFADLLSKSNHRNSEKHKMMAQEMLALLRATEIDNSEVDFYLGSVLSNIGNYRGMDMVTPKHRMSTLFDRFYMEFSKELSVIPAEPEKQFFRSQVQVYKLLKEHHFSYSGPTSMGKSFIMRMFIKRLIQDGERLNFVILVPTKALINEVSSKIIKDLKDLLQEKHYKVLTSAGAEALEKDYGEPYNFVFVLTPERLLYLLIDNEELPIDYLFVDEAHKISVRDSRSTFYYQTTAMLLERGNTRHMVFASPNIPNPAEYLKLIPNITDASERGLATAFAPVSQIKYLVDFKCGTVDLFSSHKNKPVRVDQFDQDHTFFDLIRRVGKVNQDISAKRTQNIVYCSGTAKAVELALAFANSCPKTNNKELLALAKDICDEVHGDYYLADIISHGVAYHIGYLPTAIRMRIETMFSEGHIHTIFCTSTLVEGVNLPADNLFITSYKNGNNKMDVVDFRNLIGRVGRIEFNLYGNVFLVTLEDAYRFNSDEYVRLLKEDVPEQKLSVVTALSKEQKTQIVACLVRGDISLEGAAKPGSEDYAIMRKFANILLRDITKGRDSLVRREFALFALFLPESTEDKIKAMFAKNENKPDDDINISVDQTKSLTSAIHHGLEYPSIDEDTGFVDYNELMRFLEQLCEIFKWEKYESTSIGHVSKQGTHGKLRWYGVLLSQWVKGDGLRSIMEWGIRYKDEAVRKWKQPYYYGSPPKANPFIYYNHKQVMYDGTLEHRNAMISNMLEDIERVILFTISNYFLRFSNEYKRIKGVKSFDNDWFEYVEYGTTNPLSIMLQRNGFSRETSTYIRKNRNLYVVGLDTRNPRLRKSIANCGNTSVKNEVKDALYNVPELFVD